MRLAQGYNAETPARLEPTALRSRVKHSTIERLHSLWGFLYTTDKYIECNVSMSTKCFGGIWHTLFDKVHEKSGRDINFNNGSKCNNFCKILPK